MRDPYILLLLVIAMALLGLHATVTLRLLDRTMEDRRRRLRKVRTIEIIGHCVVLVIIVALMAASVIIVFYPSIITTHL